MDPKLPDDALHWARSRLGLPPEADSDTARGDLLRQLQEIDFAPTADWDDARRLADQAERGVALDRLALVAARRAADDAARAEVEAFAARLFSLSPEARVAQYQQLAKRCCETPAAASRLEALREAFMLPCALPSDQPPDVVELLNDLLRLFALPQPKRAYKRTALLAGRRNDPQRWREAARLVQRRFARYAALDPALVSELAAPENRTQIRAKIARWRRRAALPPGWPTRVVRATRQLPASVCFVLLFFVLGLIGGVYKDADKHPHAPPAPPRFDVKKANEELNEMVNKSLREGQPIGEALRRLYGLPPGEKPSPLPKTSPSPASQPPGFSAIDANDEKADTSPTESQPGGESPHRVYIVPEEGEFSAEDSREAP